MKKQKVKWKQKMWWDNKDRKWKPLIKGEKREFYPKKDTKP